MNSIDRIISFLSPGWAFKRVQYRNVLAYYEAATPSRLRAGRKEEGSGNTAVLKAGTSLRAQARHLEQNLDLARGILNVLVANVIGPNGIGIEPAPRARGGEIDSDLAKEIMHLWRDWSVRPEVTWCHDWASAQRMLCRTWMRDGEVFTQILEGTIASLDHGTVVPLSIEMLEPDFVPIDFNEEKNLITSGIQINAWGKPRNYYVFKSHPGDARTYLTEKKTISADNMLHIKCVDRIRQLRGVSVFASVLTRLEDIKDYEESERIAAKIAASMAGYIKKGTPDLYNASAEKRNMKFSAGMIFDDLLPGEEIGTIDSKRPNPNVEVYRKGQLRAVSSGVGTTYSSLAKDYDGTYSSQRQEMVEAYGAYQTLSSEFTSRIVRPIYERFIAIAIASGALKVNKKMEFHHLTEAIFVPPQMPWIDPEKEANGYEIQERNSYISGPEIIRRRGANPMDVLDQQERWKKEKDARNLGNEDAQKK